MLDRTEDLYRKRYICFPEMEIPKSIDVNVPFRPNKDEFCLVYFNENLNDILKELCASNPVVCKCTVEAQDGNRNSPVTVLRYDHVLDLNSTDAIRDAAAARNVTQVFYRSRHGAPPACAVALGQIAGRVCVANSLRGVLGVPRDHVAVKVESPHEYIERVLRVPHMTDVEIDAILDE